MASIGGNFLFCSKIEQRRAVAVCINKGCTHLEPHKEDNLNLCTFLSADERRVKKAEKIQTQKEEGK